MSGDLTFDGITLALAYPKGPPHEPDPNGQLANFREGDAQILTDIRVNVKSLAFIRDPANTPALSDLEHDYGITPADNISEADRRDILKTSRYPRATTGNDDDLQMLLDKAFGVGVLFVYNNSPDGPAIDPAPILDASFQMTAKGGTNYYAGNDEAYAGRIGGYLLVNGDVFDQSPDIFGAGEIWAGNDNAVAGYFEALKQTQVEYPLPTNSDDWPFFPVVGGVAVIEGVTCERLDIEQAVIPAAQKKRLDDIVLRFKPMFDSVGMIVSFS